MFGGPESQTLTPAAHPHSTETKVRPDRGNRGRPRIQAEQEVSVNRRRIQLRLAQRAYRSRKEATLLSLKSRVHQLGMLVEQLNKTFLSFTDELMNCDVLASYPDLAGKLFQTLEQSLSLANQAISVTDETDDDNDDDEEDCSTSVADAEVPETNAKLSVPAKAARKALVMPKKQITPSTSGSNSSQGPQREKESKNLNQGSRNQTSIMVPEILTGAVQFSTTPSSINVPSASIYEPEQGGFAHRLYYACIEYGYRHLRDPSSQLEPLTRRFRFPLTMMTPLSLILHFEESLRYGYYGPPMELNIPFFSIGGAGMHFKHDQRSYASDDGTLRPDVIHIPPDQIGRDMAGDWFDCYDVEGYLKRAKVVPVRQLPMSTKLPPAHLLGSNASLHTRYLSDNDDKVIDETVFIELLTRSCYCLGRAPGFARRTVESFIMEHAKSCSR